MLNKIKDRYLAVIAMVVVMMMSVTAKAADYDFDSLVSGGDTAEDVASNIDGYSVIFYNTVKTVGVLAGAITIFAGIMRLKKANDPQSNVSMWQGLVLIIVGGLFASLPFLLLTSASTVQG